MIKGAVIGGTECVNENISLTPIWNNYDILIINFLPLDLLAKTALGFETEIIKAIKANKGVYLTTQGIKHIDKLPKPLILLYNAHINTLKTFGVKLIDCTDNIFKDKNTKKLLTVADLETFNNTNLSINKSTIITPLALDFAKENNITIIRDDTV